MTFVWAVKCFRSFFTLLFAIKTISDPLLWNVESMYIESVDNVFDTCCPNRSHISSILEKFLVRKYFPNNFLRRQGELQLYGFIFATYVARHHCITLITVSPHSKLLVFLQTAHITPRNLIIGTHYVFRAPSVNIGNLWHAPPQSFLFHCEGLRLASAELKWFKF